MESDVIKYRKVSYKVFVAELWCHYLDYKAAKDNNRELALALCINKTTMSVRNCLQAKKQIASDKVLSSLMKCLNMKGKIEWENGVRNYLIEIK